MLSQSARLVAIAVKVVALISGLAVTGYATGYLYDEIAYISQQGGGSVGEVVVALSAMSLALTGIALIASLPDSLRVRFRRPPKVKTA